MLRLGSTARLYRKIAARRVAEMRRITRMHKGLLAWTLLCFDDRQISKEPSRW